MGGDAFDMVLYLFVLGPAVEWCLKSPRVNGKRPGSRRGITLAVVLLAAIATLRLSAEIWGGPENAFQVLGLRVDASTAEIKKAYKTISLKHHPDKNPDDPKAAEKFIRYQSAYEVLKDPQARSKYNQFGPSASDDGLSSQWTSMALFYVIWFVVGYLLTMGKASEDARTWAFSGLLALAVFEYQTRILSVDYLTPIFPYTTAHEKVELLHKLFPPFMHGARMISGVVYRDVTLYNKMLVEQMHLKIDGLGRLVIFLRKELDQRGLPGHKPTSLTQAGDSSAQATLGQQVEALGSQPDAAHAWEAMLTAPPAASAQPGAPAAAGAPDAAASTEAAAAAAVSAARNQNRMTNIVCFFAVYAGFKYLVDNDLWA